MIILNGWLNGLSGSKESRKIIEEINNNGIIANDAFMNGEVAFQFYMCHNHLGSSFDLFFKKLNELLKIEDNEVYGVIYFNDDEDPKFYDSWQVWLVRKGIIEKVEDTFLSPLSEKIENY